MEQTAQNGSTATQVSTSTPYVFSDWQPIYEGIDRAVGTADLAFDAIPPVLPSPVARKQYVNALRIDLNNANISFYTTPTGGKYQTLGNTVTGFLNAEPAVMVAINANFSWYDNDVVNGNFSLLGLAMSQGNIVCDPRIPAPQPPPGTTQADVPDSTYAGAMAMLITEENKVNFQYVTQENPDIPSGTYTAIAGSPQPQGVGTGWPPQPQVPGPILLVETGLNQATPEALPGEKVAGRTGVGLDATGQYLYIVTLDGCEHAVWPYGGGFYDIAQWLVIAGANTALNLDGGGSTTMACRDSNGDPILMNIPFGDEHTAGFQRPVGNFFGIVTEPLS